MDFLDSLGEASRAMRDFTLSVGVDVPQVLSGENAKQAPREVDLQVEGLPAVPRVQTNRDREVNSREIVERETVSPFGFMQAMVSPMQEASTQVDGRAEQKTVDNSELVQAIRELTKAMQDKSGDTGLNFKGDAPRLPPIRDVFKSEGD